MLEKPDIQDEKITNCLRNSHGLDGAEIEFLPIGYDVNAGVYKVGAGDGNNYFLKVKRGGIHKTGLTVPRYLRDQGIQEVIAPLPTTDGKLWTEVDDFALILYPFVDGDNGMKLGLTERQWNTLGAAMKRVHTAPVSPDLFAQVEHETFSPEARIYVRELQERMRAETFENPLERQMAAVWNEKRAEITRLVEMAEKLAGVLQRQPLEQVICHSDIHAANVMLSDEGVVYIVDWDEPILAPKERDLMFVGGKCVGRLDEYEEAGFYQGYGMVEIDYVALAYYRYERIVQDFMEFGKDIFARPNLSAEEKQLALRYTDGQFMAGEVIDIAHQTEAHLPPELRYKV